VTSPIIGVLVPIPRGRELPARTMRRFRDDLTLAAAVDQKFSKATLLVLAVDEYELWQELLDQLDVLVLRGLVSGGYQANVTRIIAEAQRCGVVVYAFVGGQLVRWLRQHAPEAD
jgi:hypothetical protein